MNFPRPTFSGTISILALFIALGGTSYAAITITGGNVRNGTLTGKDLKNESVKGADIDNGSVGGSDVKNGSLRATDFRSGDLPAGPTGPQGPQGIEGPQGAPGASNIVTRRRDEPVADQQVNVSIATCLAGERAVGGGGGVTAAPFVNILETEPREADLSSPEDGEVATAWAARAINVSGSPQVISAYVLCASP